ncbi:MAG: hypothetical protein EOO77_25005 [Oxalobacteraceae bacterium]|nr:MAG: hypothetical protein EOO77_25005 [Oxalobacteraceae bacterium]
MANPYTRTSTPVVTYVGMYANEACFRIHLAGEEGLNGLLYRGEIAEHLLKESVAHRLGNVIRGIELPENPARKDFFLMIDKAAIRTFTDKFEVSGYSPDLGGK